MSPLKKPGKYTRRYCRALLRLERILDQDEHPGREDQENAALQDVRQTLAAAAPAWGCGDESPPSAWLREKVARLEALRTGEHDA